MTTRDDPSRAKAKAGRLRAAGQRLRAALPDVGELLCVAVLLLGVGLVYVPAALILGGALGVWVCERAAAVRKRAARAAAAEYEARAGGVR